mmetsp:Transcript_12263/g.14514  ORF Transcript_12263/g.14514 Transcript_12263/m.14514 type:complete len:281 (-) Transcript_12263:215-1057(-)
MDVYDDLEEEAWFCTSCPVKVKNTGPTCILCGAENTAGDEGEEYGRAAEKGGGSRWTASSQQFHQDAKDGEIDKIMGHIANGIDVNIEDPNGETALMQASYWGHKDVMLELIEAKASINHIGWKEGWTALMRASKSANTDAVSTLIKAGADVTIQNHGGQRAFDLAGAFNGTSAIPIKKLLSAELHRWVMAHLESACKMPMKAVGIILQYHCPEFGEELEREIEMRRLKDAENEHKTDDRSDANQDAMRRQREAQLRREYGSQRRQIRWQANGNRYDDYW